MKVTIFGCGYVGLVTGACLADLGNEVLCVDSDSARIDLLRGGTIPIHEPGLAELVARNVGAARLAFTTDAADGVRHGRILFIAVGTPPREDGSADVEHVLTVARSIGRHLDTPKVVVDKSTVPVGTAARVREAIAVELGRRDVAVTFGVVSNPEFLKEGAAVEDFMRPDRIVLGSDDDASTEVMRRLYAPFERNHAKLMVMDVASAELTKYAANAMLATRISFMNELAQVAEKIGADIDSVRRGIGADRRIGSHFLYAGCGYGGSCFPKDIRALLHAGEAAGVEMPLVDAVQRVNDRQKHLLLDRIVARFGDDLSGRMFAIWGLAFKPGTDDMREAPSEVIIRGLLERDAKVQAYDPVAVKSATAMFGDAPGLSFATGALAALAGADALIIVTEWKEFRSPDLEAMHATMRQPVIFDGRNILDPAAAREAGFHYSGIGRPS